MAKKASFAAASFANLRAAAGEGEGEPLRIALVDIDEDSNQPRRAFDLAELEGMALTIREKGVLQPVSVRPPQGGRYTLVFGARRFRAAKLAGQADIPAIVVPEGQRDFAAQVIENQQRANLSNSELARPSATSGTTRLPPSGPSRSCPTSCGNAWIMRTCGRPTTCTGRGRSTPARSRPRCRTRTPS